MMSFGLCPHTGKTFAEKFPVEVFEALPEPSAVTSAVQFARAREIEAAYMGVGPQWKEGAKKYLFIMINEHDNIGFFYSCPEDVRSCNFIDANYPANFRWFVIDPSVKEEVTFVADQIAHFWDDVRGCEMRGGLDKYWWVWPLIAHNLGFWKPDHYAEDIGPIE